MKILKKLLGYLQRPRINYQPLIEVRIFKDALQYNLKTFQKQYPKFQFAPVLKSNAYGHGLVEVAKILDEANSTLSVPRMHSGHLPQRGRWEHPIPFFMVDSFFEALTLRRAGITSKILILGYCRKEQILNNKLKNISFGIIDLEQLKNISSKLKSRQNFHLKIDTGMHRQGILPEQINEAIGLVKSNKNIILEGVCSHLADADGTSPSFTEKQILEWNQAAKKFRQQFSNIKYFHLSNTAGTHYAKQADANVARLGIGLYGINPSPFEEIDLRPALEMVSIISSIKHIPAKEKVGYGISFESPSPMIVATVPVGYNEGVDRRLSNKGVYKIGSTFCPLVGRVSMNISSVDVSAVPNIKLEDEVIIISSNKTDKNSVENIVRLYECIPYEVLVHIPSQLRRTVV